MSSICSSLLAYWRSSSVRDRCNYSSSGDGEFGFPLCWREVGPQQVDVVQDYERIRNQPLDQRIVYPNPETYPCRAVIDGRIQITAPNSVFAERALTFWKGKKIVHALTMLGSGALGVITFIATKPIAAAIAVSSPFLSIAFVVSAAALDTLCFVVSMFNFFAYQESRNEANAWQSIQIKVANQGDLLKQGRYG